MMRKSKEKLVRTTITLPASLKQEMSKTRTNWSEVIRNMLRQRLEEEGQPDMTEAVILNEGVRRPAPGNWDALKVIKHWRKRVST